MLAISTKRQVIFAGYVYLGRMAVCTYYRNIHLNPIITELLNYFYGKETVRRSNTYYVVIYFCHFDKQTYRTYKKNFNIP